MPAPLDAQTNGTAEPQQPKPRSKLLVCFDGTGNQYSGDTSDTNIVKLYQKFDRDAPHQYHYYQPGIGTYSAAEGSLNAGILGRTARSVSQKIDEGIGTTFDQHVIVGYRFVMRYYNEHDRIFIFGFSRGAFTARFLARMISTVGLLSRGNEEMVPFAYKTYQDYEMGIGNFKSAEEHNAYMKSFKTTFCRAKVKVHFLGLFDTVNSVGIFDVPFTKKTYLPVVTRTATHVRHAVSIDERRSKFKAALLHQDKRQTRKKEEDIKEVFFPGNHGDIGGGWLAEGNTAVEEAKDPLQLSDIALEWMISELDALPLKHPADQIAWNEHHDIFLENFHKNMDQAVTARMHDALKFGGGGSWTSTLFWHFLEWIPLFKRLELINDQWRHIYFPPNMGGTRDIPDGAEFHPSVKARMESCPDYRPRNEGILKA